MALDTTYQNQLQALLQNPSSFSMSPDAQIGMKYGQQALGASNSAMRGSGNALAALVKYGNDQSQADYGNQVSRLGTLAGQAQQYDLGQVQNQNQANSIANQFSLGQQQNANTLTLGNENAQNTKYGIDQSTGLGYFNDANNFSLGQQQNANTAQNNLFNYTLGQGQNQNQAANIFANYDLGQGQNAVNWYNAGTNRGVAQTNAYNTDQTNQMNWYKTLPHQGTNPNTGGQWYNPGG